MVDVRETYTQQIDAARLALSRGDRIGAAESLRSAIGLARGNSGLERELASALVQLGKLEQEFGRPVEAERLLHESLDIGERLFGAEHPSLAVSLNELGRLHIRQADHARAEAVLERLLRITRSKGEEHPDVATALAGLAVVKRGLHDDAAAEQLYRDALRIREKVLAPNHMAIVITLEQLSETCAARGNNGEALALLLRALPTREAALGGDHATVRAMRARITTLRMRRSAGTTAAAVAKAAAARLATVAAGPVATPARSVVAHADAPTGGRAHSVAAPSVVAPRVAAPSVAAPSVVAYADAAPISVTSGSWQPTASSFPADLDESSSNRRTSLYLSAGLAVVLAIGALTLRLSAAPASGDAAVAPRSAAAATGNGAVTLGAGSDDAPSVSTTSESLALLAKAEKHAAENAVAAAPPSLPVAPRRLARLTVPVITTNVDSLVRASTKVSRESDQIGIVGGLKTSQTGDDANGTPPVLLGKAPMPYFPDALRSQRTEGEVIVRFRVDERGRVDESSLKVLKSDHPLFTLAVRSVLSRFRFEPARSPAPESKPRAEWVDFRTEFTAKN